MKLNKLMGALLATMLCCSTALISKDMTNTVKPNNCKGPVLCSSFPVYGQEQDCCNGVFHIDAGLLYQQPWFSDMTAGTVYTLNSKQVVNQANAGLAWSTSGTSPTEMTDTNSSNIEPCFDYSLGLTLSLGRLFSHDAWFFGIEFDYLSASKNKTYDDGNSYYYPPSFFDPIVAAYQMGYLPGWGLLNPDSANFNAPNLGSPSLIIPDAGSDLYLYGGSFSEVQYSAKINYYNLDFVLSRGSYNSTWYSLEPFTGVKALWFNGYQDVGFYTSEAGELSVSSGTYQAFSGYTSLQSDSDFVSVKSTFSANGVGPMFGFNGVYNITNEIAIFTDSDIAVLYGQMNTKIASFFSNKANTADPSGVTDTKKFNSRQEYFVPVRTVLGILLNTYCMNDEHYVGVKIGYDARYIFTSNVRKDFAMNGLLVNFIWDF